MNRIEAKMKALQEKGEKHLSLILQQDFRILREQRNC